MNTTDELINHIDSPAGASNSRPARASVRPAVRISLSSASLPARWVAALMPLYVIAMTVINSLFDHQSATAGVSPELATGAILAALLMFAASLFFVDRWNVRREAAEQKGRATGAAPTLRQQHPDLADLLQIAVGVPDNQAIGYLVGFMTSGVISFGLTRAAILCFGGTSVPMLIVLNILAYTAFFAVAMYINALAALARRLARLDSPSLWRC